MTCIAQILRIFLFFLKITVVSNVGIQLFAGEPVLAQGAKTRKQAITIEEIVIVGNTVFEDRELKLLLGLKVGDRVFLEQLNEAKAQIDRYYEEKGYLSSGSLLLSQELSAGKIEIQVVETILSEILITGEKGLSEEYLKSQLPTRGKPVNYVELTESLATLENHPLVEEIEGEIVQNSFGQNSLLVRVIENDPVTFSIGLNNAYSPGIGSFGGNASLTHLNLLGVRDRLTIERSLTEGLSRTGAAYSFPFNRQEGRISFAYSNADSRVVEEAVADFNITADYESFTLAIEQPVVNNLSEVFSLGISIEYTDTETFVLDEDFSFAFTPGLPDGESKSTVLRLTQEYSQKRNTSLWGIRSQFNIGLNVLDTTKTAVGIDGLFWSWTGEMSYLKSFDTEKNSLFVATLNLQLTPDKLLPIEQVTIGGVGKGMGYRPNIGVGDNGIVGTLGLQFSLAEGDFGNLSLGPFLHWGTVWNNDRSTTGSNDFLSTGLSLQYRLNFLELRLDYGLPLIELENYGATDTEDNFSFSILFRPL